VNDIFLSYASPDREKAKLVARVLEARGWSVWWDREIPPGKSYDEVIEEALDASNCIVVLWSKASAASGWVRAEAEEGVRRRILVPATIELATIPLGFRRIQAADLTGWKGDASHPEFRKLLEAIEGCLGQRPRAQKEPEVPPPLVVLAKPKFPLLAIGLVLVAFVMLEGVLLINSRTSTVSSAPDATTSPAQIGVAQPVVSAKEQSSPTGDPGALSSPAPSADLGANSVATAIQSPSPGMAASGAPTTATQVVASIDSASGAASPIDEICGPVEPNLATNPNAGPPVPTKPCGIDVTECARDVKSCLAGVQQKFNADASAQIGYVYLNGLGIASDLATARNWSNDASMMGNALGQDTMGRILREGVEGSAPDYAGAYKQFSAAAAQGCALAQNDLGDLYSRGNGVERDYATAMAWYRKAADQNDSMGENNVGSMYNWGRGVPIDPKQAVAWYVKAARQGNPYSQGALGYMYQTGSGVERDLVKAANCYQSGAKQGYAEAQLYLGQAYASGEGVPQDRAEAAKWYCRASAGGNVKGQVMAKSIGFDCDSMQTTAAVPGP
jgi:TPR repeat protein